MYSTKMTMGCQAATVPATSGLARRAVRPLRAATVVRTAVAPNGRPTVLVAEKLGAGGVEMLKDVADVKTALNMSKEELLDVISQADALVIRSATKARPFVTREVFEASKGRLRVVGRAGVGIDNVDLTAASENGCLVVNAPTANTVAAAEHGIALLTALARNVAQADASMKAGRWDRTTYVGVSVVGKTLAIIGFGKVGGEVARRAKGLGMKVVAYDPYASEERAVALGVKLVTFDEALATGDFFSLHMPLTPGTKNLFGDEAFSKIKKGARIINVAGAALDVFAKEPPAADNPLVGRPEVICTPHLGASTKEAQEEVSYEIAEAVLSALNGELTSSVVNAPMVPPEVLKELAPFVDLAQSLGHVAMQLVDNVHGFSEVHITYNTPRGDVLDTRLLRANVVRGILQQVTTAQVNIVNADLLAKKRGLRIVETSVPSEGTAALTGMTVSIVSAGSRFSSALNSTGQISVSGAVKGGKPFLTQIGGFDLDLEAEGEVLLVRQSDQPGIIATVASELAKKNINISFMSVGRTGRGADAIMAIGIDDTPDADLLKIVAGVKGVKECTSVNNIA
ncbi:hypothetical protein QBZ16_001458 [Prototheca wickerhamii]|uniref:D-3-phosphoglycerate dehydrogenase n=1 Tax=Prototheca wickerhamii TaxID=3111 RepID=A0AAD9IGG6_PROWI|nr:hypothetical protein QBZ16_001458 [Prototheca wickerhamii]